MLIAAVVIVNSTVFRVNSIEVNSLYTSKYSKSDLLDASSDAQGKSIFRLNKSELTATLEKAVPYANIITVEKVFPNKLIIHCVERETVVAIKIANSDTYCYLDEDLKILATTTTVNRNIACEILGIELVNMPVPKENIGDFLPESTDNKLSVLKNIFLIVKTENEALVGRSFGTFFTSIDFSTDGKIRVYTIDSTEEYWDIDINNYEAEIRSAVSEITA